MQESSEPSWAPYKQYNLTCSLVNLSACQHSIRNSATQMASNGSILITRHQMASNGSIKWHQMDQLLSMESLFPTARPIARPPDNPTTCQPARPPDRLTARRPDLWAVRPTTRPTARPTTQPNPPQIARLSGRVFEKLGAGWLVVCRAGSEKMTGMWNHENSNNAIAPH